MVCCCSRCFGCAQVDVGQLNGRCLYVIFRYPRPGFSEYEQLVLGQRLKIAKCALCRLKWLVGVVLLHLQCIRLFLNVVSTPRDSNLRGRLGLHPYRIRWQIQLLLSQPRNLASGQLTRYAQHPRAHGKVLATNVLFQWLYDEIVWLLQRRTIRPVLLSLYKFRS